MRAIYGQTGEEARVTSAVDAMEMYTDTKPGYRRAHARGIGARGHFIATSEIAGLTDVEFLSGKRIEVETRLSVGAGNPFGPDRQSSRVGEVLGLGVRFALPSGGHCTWAASNLPCFPARDPDEFVVLTVAQRRGRRTGLPNPARLLWFVARHPHSFAGLLGIFRVPVTASFATVGFNGLNTYLLVDKDGRRRPFRYRWTPDAGPARLSATQARALPHRYLADELGRRLRVAPASWTLEFDFAGPRDSLDDVSRRWRGGGSSVRAGQLVIDRIHENQELIEGYVFDPTGVPPGIELSDDPLLRFRSQVYAESHRRRTAEDRRLS